MHVFDYYKIPLFRKNVCIVGRGLLVGQPLSALLLKRMSNIVILDENNKQKVVGRIDLFASKDAKEFDRARWWLENYLEQSKNLRELYKMLTEEEKKEADNTASSFDSVREKVSKELNGGRTGISN